MLQWRLCSKWRQVSSTLSLRIGAGNAGLGAETVMALALQGAEVILGSRSLSKADQALQAFEQVAGQLQAGSSS